MKVCSAEETCKEGVDFSVKKINVNNWVQDMDIRCFSRWNIGMYGSMFFIGAMVGNIILAKYGDTIGRVKLLRVSLVLSLICYGSILYVIRNKILIYIPIFIYGFVACWCSNLAYIYGLEVIES